MYVILKRKGEDTKPEVCFVQAESAGRAKEMVGVSAESVDWGVLSIELVKAMEDAREGYFVLSF